MAIDFRYNDDRLHSTISYQTSGDEALVFANKYAYASFLFITNEDSVTNHGSDRWESLTSAGLQIKENSVQIGGLWGNDVHPDYKLKVNGTSYFTDFIRIHRNKSLIQDQASDSNYTIIIEWRKGGGAGQSGFTYNPHVGQHNTGGADGSGSVCVLPYATSTDPWRGSVGLFITKNKLMLDNCRVPTTGNTSGNIGSASQPVYVNNGIITAITGSIANDTTGKAAGLSYYSIDNNLTVAQAKDQIRSKLTNKGIAAAVLSSSYIDQWNTNTASYYDSSVHSVIALNPGYNNTTYGHFLVAHYGDRDLRHIGVDGGHWGSLRTLLDSVNYTSYTVTKTGGGASGTWNININGNASSATNADTLDGYHESSFLRYSGWWPGSSGQNINDASGMVFAYSDHGLPGSWGVVTTFEASKDSSYRHQIYGDGWNNEMYFRTCSSDRGGWSAWRHLLDDVNYRGILDGSYVKKSGDTMTGALIPHVVGGAWYQPIINLAGASGLYTDASGSTSSTYWPFYSLKFPNTTYSIGGERAVDVFGIFMYKNTRTENGYDAGLYVGADTYFRCTTRLYGAVWNDYAEYRSTSKVQPGQCVIETGLGDLVQSTKRLQPGANIVSDTFGFAIGETEKTKTPLAVSGRVLAYPYEDRYSYSAGDPVCSGHNGTISKMTRKEVREYPDRIVGTVSEIPEYKTWGTGNVKVNGRIWIKVR